MAVVSPIGALIEEVQQVHLDSTGTVLSYGAIAKRTRAGLDAGLSRQRVQQIANDPIKRMPDAKTIVRLARGLRMPETVVAERYLRSVGIPGPGYERLLTKEAGPTVTAIMLDPVLNRTPGKAERVLAAYAAELGEDPPPDGTGSARRAGSGETPRAARS